MNLETYAGSLELRDIVIFAEQVQRHLEPSAGEPAVEGVLENTFSLQNHDNFSTFRFKFTLKNNLAEMSVDLGVVFSNEIPVDVDQETQLEFASKVALMVAYPYVRNSLWSSAARLGLPRPLLGLIRPDQVKFEPNPQV